MIYLVDKLAKHPTKRYGKRRLNQIGYYVVHHSGNDGDVYSAARYHVKEKDWPGISYTFWISQEGQILTANDMDTISYGVADNNTRCLSICLQGNFEDKMPGESQLKALNRLISNLSEFIGPRPVKTHRDFVATGCPGNKLDIWINTTYPSPEPLTIQLSWFSRMWKKWFVTDPDHPEIL